MDTTKELIAKIRVKSKRLTYLRSEWLIYEKEILALSSELADYKSSTKKEDVFFLFFRLCYIIMQLEEQFLTKKFLSKKKCHLARWNIIFYNQSKISTTNKILMKFREATKHFDKLQFLDIICKICAVCGDYGDKFSEFSVNYDDDMVEALLIEAELLVNDSAIEIVKFLFSSYENNFI